MNLCSLLCRSCNRPYNMYSVAAQLTAEIRRHIARYYEFWLLCDEPSCRNRTRQMSVYGKTCIMAHCHGMMLPEVSTVRMEDRKHVVVFRS